MKLKTYRYLYAMNEGFDQVQRSLKSLAKHSPLDRSEIRHFEQLAAEACAAANSFLLEALGAEETDLAGHLVRAAKSAGAQGEKG